MNSFSPITNPSFTSEAHWGITDDPANKKNNKSLLDQIAKTQKGRVMQWYAGQIRDEFQESAEDRYEIIFESEEFRKVAKLVFEGELGIDADGNLGFASNLRSKDLARIRETLLDIKLDQDSLTERRTVRESVNEITNIIDTEIEAREIEEAPETLVSALDQLVELQNQVSQTIGQKDWRRLGRLNEQLIMKSVELLEAFNLLRTSDPDKMLDLAEDLQKGGGRNLKAYKTALIEYVSTHNSFSFSDMTASGLAYQALNDCKYDSRRKGRKTFVQALHTAYRAPKQEDDDLGFIQSVSRIPKKRFDQIVREAMAA